MEQFQSSSKYMEQIQKRSNSVMYAVVGIIVLIIILVLVMSDKKDKAMEDSSMNDSMVEDTSGTMPNVGTTNPDREGTSVSNAGKYADLVLKYEDRTLQFNNECQVSKQNTKGFKVGTDVLLDNRGDKSIKIVIGSKTYNLKPYGYRVIDLGSVGTYQVDCNERFNVLTVNVQK